MTLDEQLIEDFFASHRLSSRNVESAALAALQQYHDEHLLAALAQDNRNDYQISVQSFRSFSPDQCYLLGFNGFVGEVSNARLYSEAENAKELIAKPYGGDFGKAVLAFRDSLSAEYQKHWKGMVNKDDAAYIADSIAALSGPDIEAAEVTAIGMRLYKLMSGHLKDELKGRANASDTASSMAAALKPISQALPSPGNRGFEYQISISDAVRRQSWEELTDLVQERSRNNLEAQLSHPEQALQARADAAGMFAKLVQSEYKSDST